MRAHRPTSAWWRRRICCAASGWSHAATSRRRCTPMVARAVGKPLPHDSAHLHVSGQAAYTDDLPEPRDLLHLAVGKSTVAHARVRDIELADVLAVDGVVDVCTAADIPGENNYGSIVKDDPLFANGLVQYVGQPVFVVAATNVDAARRAASRANIRYDTLVAILVPLDALSIQSFLLPAETLVRVYPAAALESASHRV